MTIEKFASAIRNEADLKKFVNSAEFIELTKNKFQPGRVPYVHSFKSPDGDEIRIKFVDTVKIIRNSKNQEVPGKESFLCYIDFSALPQGQKGFSFSQDCLQSVWANGRSAALVKHNAALQEIRSRAEELGIDLSDPLSWCTVYSENY